MSRAPAGSGFRAPVIVQFRVDVLKRQLMFWSAALDYVPRNDPDEGFVVLRPRAGLGVRRNWRLRVLGGRFIRPKSKRLDKVPLVQGRNGDSGLCIAARQMELS